MSISNVLMLYCIWQGAHDISPDRRPIENNFAFMHDSFAGKVHVLVADDDKISLQYVVAALHELGCTATAANNGKTALVCCTDSQHFDLLLLDRCMPDLGGAALLHAIRAQGCEARAIATSAQFDANMRDELLTAGFAATLTKPFTIEQLAQLLRTHLSQQQVQQTHRNDDATVDELGIEILDDRHALASIGGDRNTLHALRRLLAQELQARLHVHANKAPVITDLADWLHRLHASCRYCGTPLLGAAASRLERLLRIEKCDAQALRNFLDICQRTLDALNDKTGCEH